MLQIICHLIILLDVKLENYERQARNVRFIMIYQFTDITN